MERTDYTFLEVSTSDAVTTVRLRPTPITSEVEGVRDRHWELGSFFSGIRDDGNSRVIILTGAEPGQFLVGPTTESYSDGEGWDAFTDPKLMWEIFSGIIRCHEAMAALEKPVLAKVNGDAIGFGASLIFGADLIVVTEDARIADAHLGMGAVAPYGPPFGVVPGDGGVALAPLFMTPTKAKEYLMLSRELSGRELASLGVANYAVPESNLDDCVSRIVEELLRRPFYALAWTKRVLNRHIVSSLNTTLDAAAAYEMVNLYQLGASRPQQR